MYLSYCQDFVGALEIHMPSSDSKNLH